MLEKICRDLGLEVGEAWESLDGQTFMIDRNKLWVYARKDSFFFSSKKREASDSQYKKFLKGEIIPKWKPKNGDTYYIPRIVPVVSWRSEARTWETSVEDLFYYRYNMVHRTKDGAIQHSTDILDSLSREEII